MAHISEMLMAHPRATSSQVQALQECIEACYDCAQSCNSCADACLGEGSVQELVRCIRLTLDCATICAATGAILSRLTEPDPSLIRAQLEACIAACRVCGDECERHAGMHEHCRICAEACRRCEQVCQRMLERISVGSRAA
jgi:hypothetical protein